jgi:hypothetical protein
LCLLRSLDLLPFKLSSVVHPWVLRGAMGIRENRPSFFRPARLMQFHCSCLGAADCVNFLFRNYSCSWLVYESAPHSTQVSSAASYPSHLTRKDRCVLLLGLPCVRILSIATREGHALQQFADRAYIYRIIKNG